MTLLCSYNGVTLLCSYNGVTLLCSYNGVTFLCSYNGVTLLCSYNGVTLLCSYNGVTLLCSYNGVTLLCSYNGVTLLCSYNGVTLLCSYNGVTLLCSYNGVTLLCSYNGVTLLCSYNGVTLLCSYNGVTLLCSYNGVTLLCSYNGVTLLCSYNGVTLLCSYNGVTLLCSNNGVTLFCVTLIRFYDGEYEFLYFQSVRKIMFAIDDDDTEAIKTAVANADINGCCEEGTPLLYAVSNSRLDMIKYLCTFEGIDVNRENNSGETPLIKAVELEKVDVVQFLCGVEGIDLNRKNYKSGENPLSKAVKLKSENIIKILCNDLRIDLEHEDWETAELQNILCQSQIFYHLVIRMVVKGCHKFDISNRNRLGDTVAHMAVKSDLTDGIEFLSKQGDVDFNVINQDDKTAFDVIFSENRDLNTQDYTSVLQIACRTDGKEVVTRRDSEGRTVLHLAVLNKDEMVFNNLYEKHKSDIDVNAADKEGNTALSLAVEKKMDDVALIILSDPRLEADNHNRLEKDCYHVLKEIVNRGESTENDEFYSIMKNFLSDTAVPEIPSKNVLFTLEKLFESANDKTSVLDEFRKKIDDKKYPQDAKNIYDALLNITLIGLQKYADHKNLRYILYKGSVIKTFVQVFVDLSDEQLDDSDYLVQLLRVLYISTQANIKCDCVGPSKITNDTENEEQVNVISDFNNDIEVNNTQSVLEVTQANINMESDQSHSPYDRNTDYTKGESKTKILSRSLAKTLGEELHRKFKVQIKKILGENKDKKVKNAQLIANGIQNAYFKDESGFCDSFEKATTKTSEKLSECLHLRSVFHKCVCRGDFAFILCFLSIFIQSSDIVSDAMVGLKTFYGFSERLGIFIIALVLVTLVHENIRSVISAYETDQDLLRITLGRKDLTDEDTEKSELNYYKKCSNPILRSIKQFLWTFKLCDESGNFTKNSIKPLTFNLLSLLMLRPVVDRLIVLSHSPSHLRAIYRQQAKQKSLNQYYMILEQMPELLIQFYVFQIYFNNLRTAEDIENYGCTEHHSFAYRTKYFECVENLWRLKICAEWWEIYSMLVPFFKIPNSMVSLEKIFRILSPETPKMSAAASVFLYIAYILMIPSRLFLFAAVMHSAPNHLHVVAYLGFAISVWLIFKLCTRIRRKKDLVEKKAYEDKKEKNWTAELYIKTIWSLLLFTVRDVVVISLRSADAYLLPTSEVNYKTLRSWKKMLVISSYYFVEGVVGAVYVEHYYPCGRNTEIFKYQGWLYLITLVISVTIITLLSYILQPTKMYIIPRRFLKSAAHICSLGLLMWLLAVVTFVLTTKNSATDVRLPLIITALIILLVFLVVVVILRYFSEAKVKKSRDKDASAKEPSKDKSCFSPKFRRFLCCGGASKCLCCDSDERTTAAETIQYTALGQEVKDDYEASADYVTKEQSCCLLRISSCFCCCSNRNSTGDKTCETVGENIGMFQLRRQ